MKNYYSKSLFAIFMLFAALFAKGQDPHFSQFFMAPQMVNPAKTGTGWGDWRLMLNSRQQWNNVNTPFNTINASGDYKLTVNDDDENTAAVGLSFLSDQSMNGALKSTYSSVSVAYNLQISENQRLGLGLQTSYCNRNLDYSKLTFGEQFTSGGFDIYAPSGELSLQKMKPFISVGTGLLYNIKSDFFSLDIGAAGFHLNKPKQSFFSDNSQYVPIRYVLQLNSEYEVSHLLMIHGNAIYQQQASQNYFSIGGTLGLDISNGDRSSILFAGGWYRHRDAVYPYLGLLSGYFQLGLTYDITISKQVQQALSPQSFELSLIIRKSKPISGIIPCPGF